MARHPKLDAPTGRTQPTTQNSRLLTLPPELRNLIYLQVCKHVNTVEILYNPHKVVDTFVVLFSPTVEVLQHPLQNTCRQLRSEFSPAYAHDVFRFATNIICHTTNLAVGRTFLRDWLRALPKAASDVERKYTLRSDINMSAHQGEFKKNTSQLFRAPGKTFIADTFSKARFEVQIVLDYDFPDLDDLRLDTVHDLPANKPWLEREMLKLFREALQRYDAEQAKKKQERSARRRKRLQKSRAGRRK